MSGPLGRIDFEISLRRNTQPLILPKQIEILPVELYEKLIHLSTPFSRYYVF